MKNRSKLFYVLLSLCFCLQSYSNAESYHWQKADNIDAYVWTTETKAFDWNGDVKGEFAHGEGAVQYYNNGKKSEKIKLTLYFGADKKEYVKLGKSENLYIGDFKINGFIKTPNGKGVFVKPNGSIYAGNFSDGKIKEGYHFVNKELRYSGSFSENKYSGFGKYYRDGKVLYSGNWSNGKQNEDGTEYQDNGEFRGTYLDGKRNGLFQIERNGTIRVVKFLNNVPDLSDCKIYYNDGTMWIGALTQNYEPSGYGQTITSDGLINFENRTNGELIGEQKITFPDGSSYDGEVKNGKRNGYGIQVYSTGVTYYGNWEDDLQNGYGNLDIDDDWYYSGEWKNGLYDGEGYFSFPDFSYEGEWSAGKKNGFGTLTLANFQYEGNWENDAINGEGYISYTDGSYYEGSWKNNKRDGYGEYVWADGSSYYGQWVEDFPNGEGEINLSNGDFYTGEVECGYFSGAGTYIFANGDRYEGTFVENKKDGIGYYYFANGNSYKGEFKNNQPNGKGRFYFENGTFYDGEFENGKLKGTGSLFIPEENDYTIITSSSWSGNLIPTDGSVLFSNGDEFVGTLKNGMPTDEGTWTTREERLKGRSTAQKLREFYGAHQQTIEKAFTITESVITGINAAATIAEFIPFPPVQVVAMAVDKACDVASCVISGSNIAIKTAVLSYDINEVKQNGGSSNEIAALKKQYAKDISGDVLNLTATVGFASIQMIRAGSKAKKALEIYPNLREAAKTIEKTGELTKVAKYGKFSDKLVRGTVSVAYGKVGKELVKTYGDDAAKLLFKYGDNAMYALTEGGEAVLKIFNKGGEKALKVVFDNGEDAIKLLSKNLDNVDDVAKFIAKKGKVGIKLLETAGNAAPDIAKQFAKYGDEYFNIAKKLGSRNIQKLSKITSEYGDDALESLLKVQKENPKKLTKAIQYIEAKGLDGIHDIKKWDGKIPDNVTSATIRLARKRYKGAVKAATDAMLKLPALKLSTKEMDMIRKNPGFIYELVEKYTGKSFKDGYKEFFIRMSKQNKYQIVEIWNYSADVRNVVKGAIRNGGGKHEWLMCENFCSFLTDSKWGKDGPYLANIIDQLATDTTSVIMSNGWTHLEECMATRGNARNLRSVIHNGIRQIMKESNNADELMIKLRNWIYDNFTQEAYDAFEKVLALCIN